MHTCPLHRTLERSEFYSCHADEVANEWMGKYALLNVISDDEGDDQAKKESPVYESEVSQ